MKRCILGLSLLLAPACAVSDPQAEHPDEVTPAERADTRRRVVADGVEVRATRWSGPLINQAAASVRGSAQAKAEAKRRYVQRYGQGPSFTIVVDIARRRPEPAQGNSALWDPSSWQFSLGSKRVGPTAVDVVAVDRFPSEAGGHHERLVFEARFKPLPADDELVLYVRCNAKQGWRPMLSGAPSHGGIALRWG